jgi:glutamate synthase (ferredoxin)
MHSYRAAQIFEILGLNKTFTSKYFPYAIRIEGIGLMKKRSQKISKAFPNSKVSNLSTRNWWCLQMEDQGEKF